MGGKKNRLSTGTPAQTGTHDIESILHRSTSQRSPRQQFNDIVSILYHSRNYAKKIIFLN